MPCLGRVAHDGNGAETLLCNLLHFCEMRLAQISSVRARVRSAVQPLPAGDHSASVGVRFDLHERERTSRVLKRLLASPLLAIRCPSVRRVLGFDLPFKADVMAIGERYIDEVAYARLLRQLPPIGDIRILVPGCYMAGEDIQFWLRRGVKELQGIDVYALTAQWETIVPALRKRWGVPVAFRQGAIEDIPFGTSHFDLVSSAAVLEHVRNIDNMVKETARVLKPGGLAFHSFGPLYYSFGADHCIAAYGPDSGYDHLLLDEDEYRKRISDRCFFQRTVGNPDLAFWAVNDQFSFATAIDYLRAFQASFEIDYVAVKISQEGLAYRDRHPQLWKSLLSAGISEPDLLIKGLTVILRKPFVGASAE